MNSLLTKYMSILFYESDFIVRRERVVCILSNIDDLLLGSKYSNDFVIKNNKSVYIFFKNVSFL